MPVMIIVFKDLMTTNKNMSNGPCNEFVCTIIMVVINVFYNYKCSHICSHIIHVLVQWTFFATYDIIFGDMEMIFMDGNMDEKKDELYFERWQQMIFLENFEQKKHGGNNLC